MFVETISGAMLVVAAVLGDEGVSGWQRGRDKMFLRNGVLEVLDAALKVRPRVALLRLRGSCLGESVTLCCSDVWRMPRLLCKRLPKGLCSASGLWR
jgi:hypothetical protein